MHYLPHTVHCNTLHSTHNNTVHRLCSTLHILITVTHSIQSTIRLSTCCAVPSKERTLYLRPNHIQHSTLALSTTNLTTTHNIYSINTEQTVPKQILMPLFLLQPACSLNIMLALSYIYICNSLCGRKNSALAFLMNTLKIVLHSVFGFSLNIGGNFMVTTMIILLIAVGISHALVSVPLTQCFPNITKATFVFALSVFLFL